MAVKTARDGVLCCDKNMFQDVWGVKEGREDGNVPCGLGSGSVFSFCTETLWEQIWTGLGKKNDELLGRSVLQGRIFIYVLF